MWCRGIRGATVAVANKREDILAATRELLQKMVDSNQVEKQVVACMFFTTTPDLNAEFPALAARQLGWTETALMCGHEMDVPHSLPRCVRILILFNTEKKAEDIVHVYIKGAEVLRHSPNDGGKRA
ncbi:MAG: chorismate mutase [Chloroflexi bacterium]|nr:chorismate mutase [Chloroflexota bacterium]